MPIFNWLRKHFGKPKKQPIQPEIEVLDTLYEQVVMDEQVRQHTFKPNQTIDLNEVYVYTVERDPHRLLIKPLVFQKVKADDRHFFKMDTHTVDIAPEAYTFNDDNPLEGFISGILRDIRKGTIPATLDKNEAIRTTNEMNAERQYAQKKYNVTAIEDLVFEYKTLKDVVDMLTEETTPDYGVITS